MSIILRKKSQTNTATASEKKMKEMIESQIKSILSNFAGINRSAFIRKVQYFLVFGNCDLSGEKTISKVFLKPGSRKDYSEIKANEIEVAGVTIVEFLDFINYHGAKEVQNSTKILELI
jgi:hypothetical protein